MSSLFREIGGRRNEGNVTFFREENNKEPVCDVKVKLIRLEGGTAVLCPVAGKILRARIGASAIRSLEYFPYGLASPARADCIGVPRGRWLYAFVIRSYLRLLDRTATKRLLLEERLRRRRW